MMKVILLIACILFCSLVSGNDQGCDAKYKDGKKFATQTEFCWCDDGDEVCVDRPKSGVCPKPEEIIRRDCGSECTKDKECEKNKKCCQNDCGGGECKDPRDSNNGMKSCNGKLVKETENGDPCKKCMCDGKGKDKELLCVTLVCAACEPGYVRNASDHKCCGDCVQQEP